MTKADDTKQINEQIREAIFFEVRETFDRAHRYFEQAIRGGYAVNGYVPHYTAAQMTREVLENKTTLSGLSWTAGLEWRHMARKTKADRVRNAIKTLTRQGYLREFHTMNRQQTRDVRGYSVQMRGPYQNEDMRRAFYLQNG